MRSFGTADWCCGERKLAALILAVDSRSTSLIRWQSRCRSAKASPQTSEFGFDAFALVDDLLYGDCPPLTWFVLCVATQGILFLAEVALGKQCKTHHAGNLNYKTLQTKFGCDSTQYVGSFEPSQEERYLM